MDPNENLREQRWIVRRLLAIEDEQLQAQLAYELAGLVEALDSWITQGGFLPDAWRDK